MLAHAPVCKVVLFGSYVKRQARKESDLDFLIDTNGEIMGFDLIELICNIENEFKKNAHVFDKSKIIENSTIDKEIKKTGVVVYEK
ncbi:MAG: nucleotidyltransferase domain-containing protein [Clostridia bacterium]|nr:nucleotidyltransferase domain-containing protein [Clostridia bacterium]